MENFKYKVHQKGRDGWTLLGGYDSLELIPEKYKGEFELLIQIGSFSMTCGDMTYEIARNKT